jgi:AhpD family alkylhydroperoxidase
MAEHYHDPSDREYGKRLAQNSPEAFKQLFGGSESALHGSDTDIPEKYAELMALAVALTTQCVYCIEAHVGAAKKAGATEKEVSDTVMIAASLRAGGAMAHGMMALKMYDNDGK